MGNFTIPGIYPDLFNVFMNNGIIPDFNAKSIPVAFMLLGIKAEERKNHQANKKDQDPQYFIHICKGKTKNSWPYYRAPNFVSLPNHGINSHIPRHICHGLNINALGKMEVKENPGFRKLEMNELNRLSAEEYHMAGKLPIIVILDNIRSCHNIGSVFRTSDALLIEKIFLCGITATPPNKEIHKTALDAEKTVSWEYFEETLDVVKKLQGSGYKVFAVEQVENSIMLPDFKIDVQGKTALVFGNELKGVQQPVIDQCDGAIEIPQYGTKHSFNISVSAGIVLWEITRQFP